MATPEVVGSSFSSPRSFVLLVGIQKELFEACFGKENEWSAELRYLAAENFSANDLKALLQDNGLRSVVFDDEEMEHFDILKNYYDNGGLLIYFGIEGVFESPKSLSRLLGLDWSFSGYTSHDYVLTPVAKHYLGTHVTEQQYSKSNLLRVPEEDRLMIPKHPYGTFDKYLQEEFCFDGNDPTPEDLQEAREGFERLKIGLEHQVPLAMHRNENDGRILYLGFVNGDGKIPNIVRALCTKSHTQSSTTPP